MYAGGLMATDASLWLLLAFFPVIMLSERGSLRHGISVVSAAPLALLVVGAYALQKTLFSSLAPVGAQPGVAAALWCTLLFTVLLIGYWILRQRGHSALGRRLYRNLYAGFYLDEWATRATLALWPVNMPKSAAGRRTSASLDQEKLS